MNKAQIKARIADDAWHSLGYRDKIDQLRKVALVNSDNELIKRNSLVEAALLNTRAHALDAEIARNRELLVTMYGG